MAVTDELPLSQYSFDNDGLLVGVASIDGSIRGVVPE